MSHPTTFTQWRREFERDERRTLTADELLVAAFAWAAAATAAEAKPRHNSAYPPARSGTMVIEGVLYEEAPEPTERGGMHTSCDGCAFRNRVKCGEASRTGKIVFGDTCANRNTIYVRAEGNG